MYSIAFFTHETCDGIMTVLCVYLLPRVFDVSVILVSLVWITAIISGSLYSLYFLFFHPLWFFHPLYSRLWVSSTCFQTGLSRSFSFRLTLIFFRIPWYFFWNCLSVATSIFIRRGIRKSLYFDEFVFDVSNDFYITSLFLFIWCGINTRG